jgi:5'(3')-deoxyribonucleotidase
MDGTCYLDLDGVLADFHRSALMAHGQPDLFRKRPMLRGEKAWALPTHLGVSDKEFWSKFESRDWWANLALTPEARGIYALVKEAFEPNNVSICTTPSDNAGCQPGKLDWVERHFPCLQAKVVFSRHKEELAGHNCVLIDDCEQHVRRWREAGGLAFLVARPWNSSHEREPMILEDLEVWLETVGCEKVP